MREIKCRGINHETGEFVYGWYTRMREGARNFDAIIVDEEEDFVRYYIHDVKTIGQFTGLTDTSGVEIYEGDVVKWVWGTSFVGEVKFMNGGFSLIGEHVSKTFNSPYFCKCSSVIGSIHQNPELLEDI